MDDLGPYVADDDLAIGPLNSLEWDVSTVSWRDTSVDWSTFEIVIVRTPWDYQESPDEFLTVLETIVRSAARLENSLQTIRWNLDKRYLADMERRGFPIVPTARCNTTPTPQDFDKWLEQFATAELIIKPTVSATAHDTFRLTHFNAEIAEKFVNRSYIVQPFIQSIVTEGEYSMFYFNGLYSHAILKTPKTGDFRVQEEHGGTITSVEPEAELRQVSDSIARSIHPEPLYARVDLVPADSGFELMELELIEPALYLRMDADAPYRFAAAINERMAGTNAAH